MKKICRNERKLLSRALKALCLTKDYVEPVVKLPSIPGWEWYDVGKAIAELIPDDEWAEQFRLRTKDKEMLTELKDTLEEGYK